MLGGLRRATVFAHRRSITYSPLILAMSRQNEVTSRIIDEAIRRDLYSHSEHPGNRRAAREAHDALDDAWRELATLPISEQLEALGELSRSARPVLRELALQGYGSLALPHSPTPT